MFNYRTKNMSEKLAAPATSLVKALDVLLALEQSPEGRGVTDIARALGLPKSAVHRLLVTFQACGFVQQQAKTSRYTLGPVLARLGLRAADLFTPRRVARPAMEALAHEVGETIFLGVLCEERVLVVEKVEHNQVLRISPELGTTLPLRQTALGQVWLAFCPAAQREALLATLVPPESVEIMIAIGVFRRREASWRCMSMGSLCPQRKHGFRCSTTVFCTVMASLKAFASMMAISSASS